MEKVRQALQHLGEGLNEQARRPPVPFDEFLRILSARPRTVVRNVFQLFHDMIQDYVKEGVDEYEGDPESIHYAYFDSSRLFVEGSDNPFFADRLFANRLFSNVDALKLGAQQNKIYIFQGPHGSGKSTMLNNLLMRFEEYVNTDAGSCFEAVWRLDSRRLGGKALRDVPGAAGATGVGGGDNGGVPGSGEGDAAADEANGEGLPGEPFPEAVPGDDILEIPCPSHDHPLLMIPKPLRRSFLDDLFANDEFKFKLFTEKEYDWVFRESPCTICSSIYEALLERLMSPAEVFKMLYARPYRFNRRLGEGISVFNPGDKPLKQSVLTNGMLQKRINALLRDSNRVQYIFSRYAKTNNGIYALMDVKSHNAERLMDLHNIISEGVHKVDDIEENVKSLFIALMNPEDQKNIEGLQSFTDRIEYINIPYVMDINTEVAIYRNTFGKHVDEHFLPRVLHNFARVIVSTRMNEKSEAMLEWIGDPSRYRLYCDENLQLLKMEIYTGYIPQWLDEADLKRFTAKRRRRIIGESEREGIKGFSGRDSIKIFNEFYSTYAREDRLINMSDLYAFFTKVRRDLRSAIPAGFLDSLQRMYDYTVLQQVKESLYSYNEDQISRDIQNYLFAVNFEPGSVETCRFTGEKLEITEEFLAGIEARILGSMERSRRKAYRRDVQKEYTTRTLPQEILLEGKDLTDTRLFASLHERYVHNLKERVLDPFLDNENFRRAIKDFDDEDFKTYDHRIRNDVTFLMNNFCERYAYTRLGAKEVCMYVIDRDLARKYSHA